MMFNDIPAEELPQPAQRAAVAKMMAEAFPSSRTARSHAYKLGAQSALIAICTGQRLPVMYEAGTVAFDAYYAGADEGRAIWARNVAPLAYSSQRRLAPANSADVLAAELIQSGSIISVLIDTLTPAQLQEARRRLEEAGVVDKQGPVSRKAERNAVLLQTGFLHKGSSKDSLPAIVPAPEANQVH